MGHALAQLLQNMGTQRIIKDRQR